MLEGRHSEGPQHARERVWEKTHTVQQIKKNAKSFTCDRITP